MGWALSYIHQLLEGTTVEFRPRGNSMTGLIESGDLVKVRPLEVDEELCRGDIVLCKVGRSEYLHLVKAVQPNRFQIGNNRGHINGWTHRSNVYGKCVAIRGIVRA